MPGGAERSEPAVSAASAPRAPAPTTPNEVTFEKSVPKAGAKVKGETDSNVKFTFQGKVFRSTERNSTLVEVQSSDEFRVTKAALDVKELFRRARKAPAARKSR
jgi:hypothetical protein